jgi:formylmethanofuran dehydrogenase subunit C
MLAEAQRTIPDARLSVSKRFGRFKDEDEKAVRAPHVVEDETLKQLKEAWNKAHLEVLENEGRCYSSCLFAIKGIQYTAKDVEKFSIALAEFQDMEIFYVKAGYFLSALINNCPDSDFVIHTKHLDEKINCLGLFNTKNITIAGDAGDCLGFWMTGGKITVEGNAGEGAGKEMKNGEIVIDGDADYYLGYGMHGGKITVEGNTGNHAGKLMENGEIIVNGNGGDSLGIRMKGGKITVKGNAGEDIGFGMVSGEIHIEGDYESLADDIKRGKFYHKGRLIYPRGDHAS